jgi:hypothetical protein
MLLFFEVLDKEPNILAIGTIFLVMGGVGFAAVYFRRTLAIPFLVVDVFIIWAMLQEFHDPHIYPVIMNEDPSYLPITYISMTVSLALPLLALGLKSRRPPH